MPVVIAVGALVVAGLGIWLFSGTAKAETAPEKKYNPIVRVVVPAPTPVKPIVVPKTGAVTATPTQGAFYEIKKGDTGSALCVDAYGGERPTARWLKVAGHSSNLGRLARPWPDWFLPQWRNLPAPPYSEFEGHYTGAYAFVFFPYETEVPV